MTTSARRIRQQAALGLAVALVTTASACAGGTPSTDPPPPGEIEEMRVTGTVVTGVEPGCLLLDTGTTRYLLVGGDQTRLGPRQRVTVTGLAEPGTPTTCMEGIPLAVDEIHPAA
ncbi:hypothetical protein L3Q67_41455 [Saccharothrix sp. AJ9571]|nr:hypothetical protein L3Q67_41455 [Saccharothrix sp. AJ9571]